jgi:hypothetical protein
MYRLDLECNSARIEEERHSTQQTTGEIPKASSRQVQGEQAGH